MAVDPRAPCLIGVGHRTWHPADVGTEGAPEPLEMWVEVARQAADDAGAPAALEQLGQLRVVYCQAWQYDDPPGRLADRLGAKPADAAYSGIGGTVPQVLVSGAARAIASGDLDLGLVVGAEALATRRRMSKEGRKPEWSHPPAEQPSFPYDAPFHPAEVAHSIFQAYLTFALFDNARRGHLGVGLEEYRKQIGASLSSMSAVAAANPEAWFPTPRSADEIIAVGPNNRMVAYPYTKLMTSIMDVDMAAAVLVASHEQADALGVPAEHRVYLRGSAYALDPVYVAERRELWRSPAMHATSRMALDAAGVSVDDVTHLDLYSCFGSSISFARDALGLGDDTGRSVTVTGGLPYHGGPGSNYVTHSIAAMGERLREDPGSFGLVSGVGMHMTKHAYALWSTEPPADLGFLVGAGAGDAQPATDRDLEVAPVVERASGRATVATYSVLHGGGGAAEWGALVCDLPDGSRCYGRLEEPESLASVERDELIGRPVTLETNEAGVNVARLA